MRPNRITRACQQCGATFQIPQCYAEQGGKFCSQRCYWDSKQGETIPCPTCGNPFYRTASEARRGRKRCCSMKCAARWRERGKRADLRCEVCGNSFTRTLFQVSRPGHGGRFCSRSCGTIYRNKTTPTPDSKRQKLRAARLGKPNPNKKWATRSCERCGQAYERKRSWNKGRQKFCGLTCWYEFIRENPENNHLYRGGREPYYGPNWYKQAALARKRDGFTCQHCGLHQLRPRLHVHHIAPRRSFNGDYISANQLNNLVTLCIACHASVEYELTGALMQH